MGKRIVSLIMIALAIMWATAPGLSAQDLTKFVSKGPNDTRPRVVKKGEPSAASPSAASPSAAPPSAVPPSAAAPSSATPSTADKRPLNATELVSPSDEAAIQAQINAVYQNFYNSYRLGPGDIIGIYIDKHPEDSVERVTVSPVGRVYFPLLGNVTVVGKTMPQIQEYFSTAVAEYIREPRLTLSLLEAQSAKIGVLGDVKSPGVQVMTRPLRVLDAITQAGGIMETGSQSVSILRQYEDGRVQMLSVDVKKILKGKASAEENAYLHSGDTIIVHGNLFKKIGKISSVVGATSLVTFLTRGGR